MNNKFMLFIVRSLSLISQLSFGLVCLIFLASIAYIISWPQAISNGIIGTDTMSAYVYTEWLNSYFPNIPFWYPLQGGGISFSDGYPYFAHYLVALLHRLSGVSLITVFNALAFLSFPVSAIGIFLFCWKRLAYPVQPLLRQIIGVIAGVFFLISPITYIWTYQWGFYSESVSYIFIVPTLFFLDLFIERSFNNDTSWRKRLSLVTGLLFFLAAFMTHFSTGLGITHVLIALIVTKAISHKADPNFALKKSLITFLMIFIPLAGLFLWRYSAYTDYAAQVAKGGFAGYIRDPSVKVDQSILPSYGQMLGLQVYAWPDPKNTLNDWAMPVYVWIGVLLALLLAWKREQKISTFAILAVYGFFSFTTSAVLQYIHYIGPFSLLFDSRAVWTTYRVIIPIAAAYGFFCLNDLLTNIIPSKFFVWKAILKPAIITLLLLVTTVLAITKINLVFEGHSQNATQYKRLGHRLINTKNIFDISAPEKLVDEQDLAKSQLAASPEYNRKSLYEECVNSELRNYKDTNEILLTICKENYTLAKSNRDQGLNNQTYTVSQNSLEQVHNHCNNLPIQQSNSPNAWCNIFAKPYSAQLNPTQWPLPTNNTQAIINSYDKELFKLIPEKPLDTRFDMSANSASIVMRAPLLSPVSQTQLYINQLHLTSALWNFQSSVMYSSQPIYQKTGIISELAKWYGYEYLLPGGSGQTPFALYESDSNLEPIKITIPTPTEPAPEEEVTWWHVKNPTTLTTWTQKPSLLFIGDAKHYVYDQAFKVFSSSILKYDDATPFYKYEYVDDYSLQELQQFDALYLSWYKYHDTNKAHALLEKYVSAGGSLFIDTGWQYNSADWEVKGAPPFFPTNQLEWKKIGPNSPMILEKGEYIGFTPDDRNLGNLTVSGGNWGVSVPQDIRKDAQVIMQSGSNPLVIAYKYGQGKVIWSGYNTIPHIEGFKNENQSEINFANATLRWLLNREQNSSVSTLPVGVTRSDPDKISFNFQDSTATKSTLYWRESYHPKWKAYLFRGQKKSNIPTYRAGPRLTGIQLPQITKDDKLILVAEYTLEEIVLRVIALATIVTLLFYVIKITKPVEHWIKSTMRKTKKEINAMEEYKGKFKIHEDPNNANIENSE